MLLPCFLTEAVICFSCIAFSELPELNLPAPKIPYITDYIHEENTRFHHEE